MSPTYSKAQALALLILALFVTACTITPSSELALNEGVSVAESDISAFQEELIGGWRSVAPEPGENSYALRTLNVEQIVGLSK
ncbi:MAG: hypothetical protein GFH27_549331n100 [Chloroflexi bacterium AL-W]|nr:hypothetical protein [Chloroflexi bacterium AL-N1]NOK70400.1 hypothetical protein [Chloroflexi bacterium AL-N10]NOK78078.1 hypothetical protein [Chloroflexi bacterium AL-N5]NOK85177.1 hypothetical protein [Chloroflexi bacterium AL-W]NOK92166.1 hypothetical protein [Chloroflexi bacterium AL-N15]